LNKKVDISKFNNLIAFLKRQSEGYRGKKSKVFTKDEVHAFLKEANDETYLMLKVQEKNYWRRITLQNNHLFQVLLIVGISGACRRQELFQLSIKDIEDMGEFLKVQILETKTKVPREFTITPGNVSGLNLLEVFRRYFSLRSKNTRHQRFFVGYRLGKCIAHPVGINTIGGAPKQIATFLGLKNPEEYTGHAFRRSSATLLAESGADTSILKRLGGWKSTNVAEGYVDASIQNKKKIAQMILGKDNTTSKALSFKKIENT
jgi:integrase